MKMSFFNRMLASIGIGGAQVDTVLADDRLCPGEQVRGIVKIRGGNIEQDVQSIYLHLMTQYIREIDDRKITENTVIRKFKVSEPFQISPHENAEIPFSFALPFETPVTIGGNRVWLKTGLEIEAAVDPSDHDSLQVTPHPYVQTILDAVNSLGFRLRKVDCEYSPRLGKGVPFIQEFEFYPTSRFRDRLSELELVFFPNEQGVDTIVQVDRKARGLLGFFEEALDMDERKQRLFLSDAQLKQGADAVARQLADVIQYHTR